MRALVLVTSRELRAYAPAWIAALVAATLPWLAPLLPNASGQPVAEVRLATAMVLAALLGLLVAVLAGAGLLSRDLAEGRMGFFLALPLRAGTVWGGRLLAAAALVYVTIAAILLPAALAGGEITPVSEVLASKGELRVLGMNGGLALTLLGLAPLVLLLVSHQLSTALRSRSPWLLVDLAALALAAVVIGRALAKLLAAWAFTELSIALTAAAALAVAALTSGGAFGLARGGVLLARVHRAQAGAIAIGLLATAAATTGFAKWVLTVDAADVATVEAVIVAPRGPWIAALGSLRHRASYAPWMLVDPATGASLPLSAGIVERGRYHIEMSAPVVFADDSASAVWVRRGGAPTRPPEAIWVELGSRPRLVPTGITVEAPWSTELLPAGNRLAIAGRRRLEVWGERGRRLLAAAELPRESPHWQQLRWIAADRVRLARFAEGAGAAMRLQVIDLDVAARRLEVRVDRPLNQETRGVALAADGARLLLVGGWAGRGGVTLVDATSGATLAQLVPPTQEAWMSAGFLPAGRVAVATGSAGRLTLRVFDREGKLGREVPLGAGRWAWLGAPWSADLLPFTVYVRAGEGVTGSRNELRTVDLGSGRVRVLGGQLSPVAGANPWAVGDDRLAPGAPASRLFRTAGDALVRVDDVGRQTPVLPRGH